MRNIADCIFYCFQYAKILLKNSYKHTAVLQQTCIVFYLFNRPLRNFVTIKKHHLYWNEVNVLLF